MKPPSAKRLIHKKIGNDVPKGGYGENSKPALKFTSSNPDPAVNMTGGSGGLRIKAAKRALVKK